MGHEGRKFFPLIATLGLYILTSNLLGLIPGFESPTAKGLAEVGKKLNLLKGRDFRASVRRIQRHNILVVGSFIIGAPDETRSEIQNTIDFAKRVPLDIPQFNILGAHPGNDIWNEMVAKRLLDVEEYWETGIAVSDIAPTAVPLDEIRRMLNKAFFSHIARPEFITRQFAKTLKSSYRMNVMLSNLSRLGEINEDLHSVA
jgi:radical SAM superfamily enzyme YgiQ (UPF0313 family)